MLDMHIYIPGGIFSCAPLLVHEAAGFTCTALLGCGSDPAEPDRSIALPYVAIDGERWFDPSQLAAAFDQEACACAWPAGTPHPHAHAHARQPN
jgi:hypothetical protein